MHVEDSKKNHLPHLQNNLCYGNRRCFFAENNVSIVEEDRSRLILESGDSKELLSCLLDNLKKQNCELETDDGVEKIELTSQSSQDLGFKYKVTTKSGKSYFAKQVVVSAG